MGRAKKFEIGITVDKNGQRRGGAREGAGRVKCKSKLKLVSFKMYLQALKECTRFARARGISRNKACSIMLEEYATWLDHPTKIMTWGGEQGMIK